MDEITLLRKEIYETIDKLQNLENQLCGHVNTVLGYKFLNMMQSHDYITHRGYFYQNLMLQTDFLLEVEHFKERLKKNTYEN